jgi:serine/threonine protein kinase
MSDILDLKPYGINFILRPGINRISDIRVSNFASTRITSSDIIVDGLHYTDLKRLGAGSYGTTYRATGSDKKYYAIKKISNVTTSQDFYDLLKESIQQILVVETTRHLLEGPYAPILYKIGYDRNRAVIISELMDNTIWNLISSQTPEQNDITIPYILKKIARQINALQERLRFNHRDLKTDNVMYKKNADDTLNIKLIDFGFTCLTWHGLFISGGEYFKESPRCFRQERDISQLITSILWFHTERLSSKLKTRLQKILKTQHDNKKQTFTRFMKTWVNSYKYLDRNNYVIEAGQPKSVFEEMDRFKKGIQGTRVTRKAPKKRAVTPIAAPAAPVKTCPPEKIMNPVTGRCVLRSAAIGRKLEKELEALDAPAVPVVAEPALAAPAATAAPAAPADDCPPGKIRNPKTRRCVNRSGAIGKKII